MNNVTCAYCHVPLVKANRTKDHVIARNFVPVGTLQHGWNLLLRACSTCNNRKSDLENDISAITMLPPATGQWPPFEDALSEELLLAKLEGSISRLTKKPVAKSSVSENISLPLGGATATFGFVGPPQIQTERIVQLCHFQIAGFFYLITYNATKRAGHVWPGEFYWLEVTPRSDWGNPRHIVFMNTVKDWELRFVGTTAKGFFKVAIRKYPTQTFWSWVLEWNQNYRMSGFFGERDAARTLVSSFPEPKGEKIWVSEKEWWKLRAEIPLNPAQDTMFSNDTVQGTGGLRLGGTSAIGTGENRPLRPVFAP